MLLSFRLFVGILHKLQPTINHLISGFYTCDMKIRKCGMITNVVTLNLMMKEIQLTHVII